MKGAGSSRKILTLVVVAAAATTLPAAAAAAGERAPQYVSSEPSPGEKVHEAPREVSVTFSEPLDRTSSLAVVDECGRRIDIRDTDVRANKMSVELARFPSGKYVVAYKATGLAGVTGTNSGSFAFRVHAGRSCDGNGMGHGEHGNGHGNGNGHDDRRRHGGDNGAGHGMQDHDMQDHGIQSAPHSAATGAGAHTGNGMHQAAGSGNGGGRHAGHRARGHEPVCEDPSAGCPPESRAPGDGAFAADDAPGAPEASSDVVVLALALALLVGVLGGWLLRIPAR